MPPRRWKIIACLFLVLATLVVYGGVIHHPFILLDDDLYVTDNPQVQAGLTLKGVAWAFTSIYAGFWHPLTWLSHMLDCQLFGLQPGGHHLTSLLFHLTNTLLMFLWLLRSTQALGCSFMVAALFALHPLHVESVAWVAERKDVLSTFFWLLTMWAYLWYVNHPGLGRYLLVLVCFSLGLMAKPMLVTLPLVLLLLDYWPLGRLSLNRPAVANGSRASQGQKTGGGVAIKRLIWEKVPLLALAGLVSIATFYAEKGFQAVKSLEVFPLTSRIANALVAYTVYLAKMLWPTRLAVFYPHPGDAIPTWQWLGAGLMLAFLSLVILRQTRRHPYLPVGWLWYLGTLVPVIGLVQVGDHAMADRYTYVPLIGLFIIVAWGMADLAARWRAPKFLLPVGAGVVLSALMVCTWLQLRHWRDSISLLEHTIQVTRSNPLIHNNLGIALEAQGRVEQAISHYTEALRLLPNYAEAHNNLGYALASQGKVDQAIPHYTEALRLKPNFAKTHYNLGRVLASQGRPEQAISHYTEALRLQPNFYEAHNNLGNILVSQGQADQGISHYIAALRLNPNSPEANVNLGLALVSQGRAEQAISHFTAALRRNPNFAEAHFNLGVALANLGRLEEAVASFQKSLQIKPNFWEAYNNLGMIYAKQGNTDLAMAMFQKAVRINQSNSKGQKMLEILKEQKGRD